MMCTKEVSFSGNMKINGIPLCCGVARASVLQSFLVTKDFSDQDPQNIENPR